MKLMAGSNAECNLPWLVISFFIKPLGANHPRYMQVSRAAIGSNTFVVRESRKSKRTSPAIFHPDSTPSDNEHNVLKTNSGSRTARHAFVRFILKWFWKNAIVTSAIDIIDVKAATDRRRKKAIDQN